VKAEIKSSEEEEDDEEEEDSPIPGELDNPENEL